MQATARRLRRLELWSGLQAAGGTRLAFVPKWVDCVASLQLPTAGIDELTLELPVNAAYAADFTGHRVIRVWEDDARWDEWRIATVNRAPDGGTLRLSCAAIETFLAVRTAPISQVTGGSCFYNIDVIGKKPSEIIAQYVLPALAADGISWLAAGTIDQDTTIDLTLDWESPLAVLRKIADTLQLELQFRRDGTTGYFVDFLTRIGASASTVDVRYGKNLAEHSLQHTTDEQVNRVFPRGGDEEGIHATIARAVWKVNTVVGSVVTLIDPSGGDGPIAFDGQLVGLYFRKADGSLTLVTASSASAQSVTVASATGVAPGQLIQFRKNAGGDDLTFLDSPAEQASSGVVTGWPDYPDIPGTNNVVPNPVVRDWPAGDIATGWTKVGAPTTSKNVTAPFFRTAPHSLKVVANAGQGVESPAGNVSPTALRPYGSCYARLWVDTGEVRVDLVLTTGGGPQLRPLSPAVANSSVVGQWIDLGISGEDLQALGATAAAVRITAVDNGTIFYVDGAQVTETAAQQPFFEGSGGTRLWQLGNEVLRLRGAPLATFTIRMADLARVAIADTWDAIPELGAPVNVTDARILSATAGSRIAALRINYARPGDTALTISTKPADLTGSLSRPARAARLAASVLEPKDTPGVSALGPSLDVNLTPGSTSYTVNYTVSAPTFEYSVDGGTYGTVPATGFTVTRPAAGTSSKVLAFRAIKDGQTVTNTVFVPAVDQDTVSPDLSVVQTAQLNLTTSFQATVSNPSGGAAPALTVTFVNCTGQGYGGAGPHTIASGTIVVVDRPPYDDNQGTVVFKAVLSGGGAEEIQRTVLNRRPGPNLDVTVVPGSSSFTINYAVDATVFEYSIDGAAYVSVPASGFTVTRPSVGSEDKVLAFRATKDGQVMVTTVFVPALERLGPSLDVTAVPGATSYTINYTVTATTFEYSIDSAAYTSVPASGFTVTRPSVGSADKVLTFRATKDGQIVVTTVSVPAIERLGPSLDVTAVPGATSYTINYTVTATTFEYSIDSAAYTSVPASGFTVTRNAVGGAPKTLTFRAVKDTQTVTTEVSIPPQAVGTLGMSVTALASQGGGAGPPYNQIDLSWSATGMPAGTTYNCGYDNGGGNMDSDTAIATTSKTFTGVTFNGSPGKGAVFVDAVHEGRVIASVKKNKTYNI